MQRAGAVLVLVAATGTAGWLPFYGAMVAVAVAHVAFVVLARSVWLGDWRPRFGHALLIALAVRAVCLPHEPVLSDDIYRYLHEGRLVLEGVNPYTVPPADCPLELRGPYFERINNPDIPAAYPPAVQYALAAGAALTDEPWGMKLVFALFDLAVFVALWFGLPRLGVPSSRALIYGACPLLALEFAGQGHSDPVAVLFMVLALVASARRWSGAAGAALAVATAGKLIPIVLLPFVVRAVARPFVAVVAFGAVLVALYLPFVAPLDQMFCGTLEYSMRWRSNDSLFLVVHAGAEALIATGMFDGFDGSLFREPQRLAKIPLGLLGAAVLLWSWLRRHEPWRAAFWFFVFFVAAAPTLHPWYVVLLVPFLCVYPNHGLLVFTGTVFAAYHVLPGWHARGEWTEVWWVKALEYLPFYAGVVIAAFTVRARPPAAVCASRAPAAS